MNQFFGTQYSQEDLQQRVAQRRSRNGLARTMSMTMGSPTSQPNSDGGMDLTGMVGGDSLDDIIMQNNKEFQRRQSYPRPYGDEMSTDDARRSSMMEFGSSSHGLGSFQFGTSTASAGENNIRRQSSGEMDMNGFSDMLGSEMDMQNQMNYNSSLQPLNGLNLNSGGYASMSPEMVQNMMYTPLGMDAISDGDATPINMFSGNNYGFMDGNMEHVHPDFSMPTEPLSTDGSTYKSLRGTDNEALMPDTRLNASDNSVVDSPAEKNDNLSRIQSQNQNQNQDISYQSPANSNMTPKSFSHQDSYNMSAPTSTPSSRPEPGIISKPKDISHTQHTPKPPSFRNVYSSSGFDMLKALMMVASRKNPEINIGAVDMSCAFVVCDIKQNDCPIVYVSDIFERLTGYNKHEVLGRNCRFLQSPHGKVQAGVKRTYVDDDTVYYLKDKIGRKQEAQRSLINYRKGGQPFTNLLTMIPISWDTDEIQYYVGFQVDLVEQPGSVAGKGAGGSYAVNYSQGLLPRYVWQPPEGARPQSEAGQTISRDDVSAVLSSFNNSGESELTKRMWDKVLLENTDDVVHVLSLKGLFLYLSPSSRKILEYDASELVGTALSSICHPSDIVPVTRELKDTSTGAAVSVVFRIRRKNSGYTWFESHGALCVEQGKGRKCIILVGRERPVYALSRLDIDAVGGIGENELWTKLSTSGMFLFVSANVRTLIDRQPDELVGTSIQAIMRPESKVEFGRMLEKARTGKRVVFKHEILNKRGLVLQAQTTLYPGDATEGLKPTFLVAQTRFLKSATRSNTAGGPTSNSVSGSNLSARDFSGFASPKSSVGIMTEAGGAGLAIGTQDVALASADNIFDELKTTRCTSWQFELRQMEKSNRLLAEELAGLIASKKKRKRRKGAGQLQRDCANCHTRTTPEWRRGPSGQRDLCNSCGLRYAKQTGRVSPRNSTRGNDASSKLSSSSPPHKSPLRKEVTQTSQSTSNTPNLNPNPHPPTGPSSEPSSGNTGVASSSAIPGSLGGRTTAQSQPVHAPSEGFKEGGDRGITKIMEEGGT